MRWTYKLLIIIHLLLTTQSIAQPIVSAVGHHEALQLSRREPLPSRRSKRQRSPSPIGNSGFGTPSSARNSSPSRPKSKKKKGNQPPNAANNIKAKKLKTSNYRAVAMRKVPGSYKGTHDADHILEAQTVSHYLNKHRGGRAIEEKCREALKRHLNHPNNLAMLAKGDNQSKGTVVTALNGAKHPQKQFSKEVKAYIGVHKTAIKDTAKKIDDEFSPSGACTQIPLRDGGIQGAARDMIAHAGHT